MQPTIVNIQPYNRGVDPKNPVYAALTQAPVLRTAQVAPMYNPKAFTTQSGRTLQYSPSALYDYLPLNNPASATAQTSYTFFQRAIGQNVSGTAVTNEDTNLQTAGVVGAGNVFQVQKIYVVALLGVDYVTTGADAAIAGANALDDYKALMNRGCLQFNVNGMPQFFGQGIAPLLMAACPTAIGASIGLGTGNAAALGGFAPFAIMGGYDCTMYPYRLNDTLPFNVTITYNGTPPTLPSANTTTKLGIIMWGMGSRPTG